jgi:hypothetical protein
MREVVMRYGVILSVLLAGCASKMPDVHPADNGRYTLTASTPSQGSNAAAIARRLAIKQAGQYCAKDHQQLYWESFDEGTARDSYTATVTFTCR